MSLPAGKFMRLSRGDPSTARFQCTSLRVGVESHHCFEQPLIQLEETIVISAGWRADPLCLCDSVDDLCACCAKFDPIGYRLSRQLVRRNTVDQAADIRQQTSRPSHIVKLVMPLCRIKRIQCDLHLIRNTRRNLNPISSFAYTLICGQPGSEKNTESREQALCPSRPDLGGVTDGVRRKPQAIFRHSTLRSRHLIRIESLHRALRHVHAVIHRAAQRFVLSFARSCDRDVESLSSLGAAMLPVQRDIGCEAAGDFIRVRFDREASVISFDLPLHRTILERVRA